MNPDRRPDLNERPANDNRTVDLPNLFVRNYRRPPLKSSSQMVRRHLLAAALVLFAAACSIAILLIWSRK